MIEKVEYHYKIRRKADGLFSTGGYKPDWSSKGKVWKKVGHLKCHLAQFSLNSGSCYGRSNPYEDCELVQQRVVTVFEDVFVQNLDDVALAAAEVRQKKLNVRKLKEAEYKAERTRKEYERLKQELGE
jgi:hypothetical protein